MRWEHACNIFLSNAEATAAHCTSTGTSTQLDAMRQRAEGGHEMQQDPAELEDEKKQRDKVGLTQRGAVCQTGLAYQGVKLLRRGANEATGVECDWHWRPAA